MYFVNVGSVHTRSSILVPEDCTNRFVLKNLENTKCSRVRGSPNVAHVCEVRVYVRVVDGRPCLHVQVVPCPMDRSHHASDLLGYYINVVVPVKMTIEVQAQVLKVFNPFDFITSHINVDIVRVQSPLFVMK